MLQTTLPQNVSSMKCQVIGHVAFNASTDVNDYDTVHSPAGAHQHPRAKFDAYPIDFTLLASLP